MIYGNFNSFQVAKTKIELKKTRVKIKLTPRFFHVANRHLNMLKATAHQCRIFSSSSLFLFVIMMKYGIHDEQLEHYKFGKRHWYQRQMHEDFECFNNSDFTE